MKSSHRILLVEDNLIMGIATKAMLDRFGYEIEIATTGEQAVLKTSDDNWFDLILMDIDLGNGIDGTEAAKQILSKKDIPIIFLSSHTEEAFVNRVMKITRYGYVTKESHEFVLRSCIEMALNLHKKYLELEKSEKKFSAGFKNAPIGIAITSLEYGTIEEVNESFLLLTGYTEEELVGKIKLNALLYGVDETSGLTQKIIAEKKSDLKVKTKSGSILHSTVSASIIEINEKKWVLTSFLDTNTIKKTEHKLKENQTNFETLLKTLPFYSTVIDSNGIISFANKIEPVLTEENVIGKPIIDFINPAYHSLFRDKLNALFSTGTIQKFEIQAMGVNGKKDWWYKIWLTPIWENGVIQSAQQVSQNISKSKLIEHELNVVNEKIKLCLDATQDGIWDWDIVTNQEYFSPRWCEILGYTETDPDLIRTYSSWFSRIHPADQEKVSIALKNHLETNAKYNIEYRHLHKSGEYRWQNSIGQALFDDHHKPYRMVGCIRDIHESKKIQLELAANKELYESAFINSPIGISLNAPDGTWLQVNTALCQMLGYTPNEMLAVNFQKITHPDDLEESLIAYKKILAHELNSYTMEKRYLHKQGHFIWAETTVALVRHLTGEPNYFIAQIQNLTKHKQTEEALTQQKSRDQFIAEAVIITDLNRTITSWNEAAQAIYEWTAQEALGKNIDVLLQTTFTTETQHEAQNTLSKNGVWRGVVRQRTKTNKPLHIEGTVTFLKDLTGNAIGNITINRDITDRVNVEEVLQKNTLILKGFSENFNGMFAFWDKDLRCQFSNAAYLEWFGRTEEEMKGIHIQDLLGDELYKKNEPYLMACLNGKRQEFERKLIKHNKEVRYTIAQYIPQFKEGTVIGFYAMVLDITARKVAEIKLLSTLKEKDTILHEVHHRVKNNMNTMTSLLSLQAISANDPNVSLILKDAIGRIKSMGVLYDKLYKTDTYHSLDSQTYLSSLVDEVANLFVGKSITIKKQLEGITLPVQTLSPLGIILNELITNSMKHAFPNQDEGMIQISFSQNGGYAVLEYADNGIGINHTSTPSQEQFGINLLKLLTSQLNGTLTIEDSGGTCIRVKFPI